jgi:outer membrane beta-barrel protein
MTTRAPGLLVACAVVLAAIAPRAARGSAADAFENKVKPVSGQLYTKSGKVELTLPVGQLSINDAFFSKYMVGGKLGYHFNEYFSGALTASFGTTGTTGSTTVCSASTGCRPATVGELNQVPGEIKWIVGAEMAFSPLYGKLNVFAEKALHFDLFVLAGPDLVSYRDVATTAAAPGNATSPGGHVGLGGRVFFGRFMALRLEVKDVLYSVPHLATGNLQQQFFAEAGLSFFLGSGSTP